ncbi:MAG: hypothetical protein MJ109_03160 [Kiritimatiellae bacterium]|nr:hypothetical protein [Kiritimatiellia bacterium]
MSENGSSAIDREFGIWKVTRFYLPLLFQAFSQSVSYPLVAGIVTAGALGVDALTAFAQGQQIMFMIGCLGGGLVMTGMVHARTLSGYLAFRRLNAYMMIALLALQALMAFHPFDVWIFTDFLKLPPPLAEVARWTLLTGVVMNGLFFLRNVPMVVLFNNLESGKANNATIARLILTFILAFVFRRMNLVGPKWGLLALTLGVALEYVLTELYAIPYVRKMRVGVPNLSWKLAFIQFRFTLPLSFGTCLLAASPLAIAAFVGRSENAAIMLAIHYVTMGVANPIGFGALRMQPVSIQFPPEKKGDLRTLYYSIGAGAVLGIALLVFSLPGISNLYFGSYQNVNAEHIWMARSAVALYALWPIFLAIRARIEGIAAYRRRPRAVMAGQITYLLSLIAALALTLSLNTPGYLMSIIAIYFATLCTTAAIYASMK